MHDNTRLLHVISCGMNLRTGGTTPPEEPAYEKHSGARIDGGTMRMGVKGLGL